MSPCVRQIQYSELLTATIHEHAMTRRGSSAIKLSLTDQLKTNGKCTTTPDDQSTPKRVLYTSIQCKANVRRCTITKPLSNTMARHKRIILYHHHILHVQWNKQGQEVIVWYPPVRYRSVSGVSASLRMGQTKTILAGQPCSHHCYCCHYFRAYQ